MKRFGFRAFAIVAILFALFSWSCDKSGDNVDSVETLENYGDDKTFALSCDISSEVPTGEIFVNMTYEAVDYVVEAVHSVENDCSVIEFVGNLLQGEHAVSTISYVDEDSILQSLHIGCNLTVGELVNAIYPATYSLSSKMSGSGTQSSPYIINSSSALLQISENVTLNDMETSGVYFQMSGNIVIDPTKDFAGICNNYAYPFKGVFDGNGHSILCLKIERYTDTTVAEEDITVDPAALFGYVANATIANLTICDPIINGACGVGALVGVVMNDSTVTDDYGRTPTSIKGCKVTSSSNTAGITGLYYVGGLVGCVNECASLSIEECVVDLTPGYGLKLLNDSIYGSFFGGVVGGGVVTSSITATSCVNCQDISIASDTTLGGIIGGGDMVSVISCTNKGDITGGDDTLAVGGIIGGALTFSASLVANTGAISGGDYVGGVIGTTAYFDADDNDESNYGSAGVSSSSNTGDVYGNLFTGGLIGAAHASVTDSYNTGTIESLSSTAGGLVGSGVSIGTSNAHSTGTVNGYKNAGGLVGESNYFVLLNSTNSGSVTASTGASGGLIGVGGGVGAINYSSNYGSVSGGKSGYVGGIGGAIGDDDWQPDTTTMLIQSSETMGLALGGFFAEYLAEEFPIVDALVIIMKIAEAAHIAYELYNVGEEYVHVCEEREEKFEEIEDFDINYIEEDMTGFLDEIEAVVAPKTKGRYNGAISISSEVDMSYYNYCNIRDFGSYLNTNSTIGDDYSKSVHEELMDIAQDEMKVEMIEKLVITAAKVIVGCVTMGAGFAVEGTMKLVELTAVTIVAGMSLNLAEEKSSSTDYNTIALTQCANFGAVNGNGIVGRLGDRSRISDVLSAGEADDYGISDYLTNNRIEFSNVAVCVGKANQSISSDFDKFQFTDWTDDYYPLRYGDVDDTEDTYFDEDDFITQENYSDNNMTSWNLADDGKWGFAIPYGNRYVSSFAPTENTAAWTY